MKGLEILTVVLWVVASVIWAWTGRWYLALADALVAVMYGVMYF